MTSNISYLKQWLQDKHC